MLCSAVAAKIAVPGIILGSESEAGDSLLELVESFLTLRTANELSDTGNEHIRRCNGLAVVVLTHIERLDVLRIIGNEYGLLEDLLGEVSFVLGLKVNAPLNGIIELHAALLKEFDGIGIGDTSEIVVNEVLKSFDKTLVDELVEEFELCGALLHNELDDILDHRLGGVHIVVKIGERHLGLDHPELSGVALGIGLLCTEGGTEGVNVCKRHREGLNVELTRNGQAGLLAEEILRIVDLSFGSLGGICKVEGGDLEHLARALAVGACDQRSVNVNEASLEEEAVDSVSNYRTNAEHGVESVRTGTEMRDRAEILKRVALLLKRKIGSRCALKHDLGRLELEGLGSLGSQHENTLANEGRANVLLNDLLVVREFFALNNDLKI